MKIYYHDYSDQNDPSYQYYHVLEMFKKKILIHTDQVLGRKPYKKHKISSTVHFLFA